MQLAPAEYHKSSLSEHSVVNDLHRTRFFASAGSLMRTEHQGTHGTSGRKEERYTRAPGKTSEQLVRPQSGEVIYGPDLIKTWVCCSSELGF